MELLASVVEGEDFEGSFHPRNLKLTTIGVLWYHTDIFRSLGTTLTWN